jgi:hypothetical protein
MAELRNRSLRMAELRNRSRRMAELRFLMSELRKRRIWKELRKYQSYKEHVKS